MHLHADNVLASAVFLAIADKLNLPVGLELAIDGDDSNTDVINGIYTMRGL